jgi:MoxR-like ATPase
METKKITLQNGNYVCDVGVSVKEWKEILQDESLMFNTYKDALIKFYNELGHKSTCKALGEKYNISPQSFNGTITNFAKAVQKKLNRFNVVDVNGSPTFWIIPMLGRSVGGYFEWTMRPELVQAMEEINFTKQDDFVKKFKAVRRTPQYKIFLDIRKLLESSKNLILTGAPGTGKTYLAQDTSKKMLLGFGFSDLSEKGKAELMKRCRFVQFHPSCDYTDFVEGLRPKQDATGNIGFELKNGIFKDFCKAALKDCIFKDDGTYDAEKSKKYVFIIDEINRGEISKIFGELFFSIDPGYRGKKGKVQTQYANIQSDDTIFDDELGRGWFYIPENVYIIGTMNDIDRSVESFDFAMRRRFIWVEITAEESAENMSLPDESRYRMSNLNKAISNIESLNSSYHIGGAYFLTKDETGSHVNPDFKKLWELKLQPLLKEYVRGMPDADSLLEKLKKAYNAVPNDENNG